MNNKFADVKIFKIWQIPQTLQKQEKNDNF